MSVRRTDQTSAESAGPLAVKGGHLDLNRPQPTDQLMTTVALALKALLGSDDFEAAVVAALRILGEAAEIHRLKVILQRDGYHELVHEWWSPDLQSQASRGLTHFPDDQIQEYIAPMMAGQSICQFIDEVVGPLREPFERVGMRSMGVVPAFAGSKYIGMVAFDDCATRRAWSQAEMNALTIAAQAIGAASYQRDLGRRGATRATELARTNEALLRREALLKGVAEAARWLGGATDFRSGLSLALAALGKQCDFDRVYVFMRDDLADWHHFDEWTAPGIASGWPYFGAQPNPESQFLEVTTLLHQGRAYTSKQSQRTGPNAELNAAVGCLTDLIQPIFVSGKLWGSIGFDDCTAERDWAEAEVNVLRTVAEAIAAAIRRADAEREIRDTAIREHDRAAQRYASLLAASAEAARRLGAEPDLDRALAAVVRTMGEMTDYDRVYTFRSEDDDGERMSVLVANFARPPFRLLREEWTRLKEADFPEIHTVLRAGQPWQSTTLNRTGKNAEVNEAAESKSDLILPISVQGEYWGCIGFDDCRTLHEYTAPEIDALRGVAEAIAAAIKRSELEREKTEAVARERESAAQQRVSELAKTNRALKTVVGTFLSSKSRMSFLDGMLEAVRDALGAITVSLQVCRPDLLRAVAYDQLHLEVAPPGLSHYLGDGLPKFSALAAYSTEPLQGKRYYAEAGIKSQLAVPVMHGEELVGALMIRLPSEEAPENEHIELAQALAHQAALAIRLTQLSVEAQREAAEKAMLEERANLARELHDTLLQSFTGITLLLSALNRRHAMDESMLASLESIEKQANRAVQEARQAVGSLRNLHAMDLSAELRRVIQEEQLELGRSIEPVLSFEFAETGDLWQILGPAATDLLRIAQESIRNAIRHSGGSTITVSVDYGRGVVAITVVDDGHGFDVSEATARSTHYGLKGMKERTQRIGARLTIRSSPDGGTAVTVEYSLPTNTVRIERGAQ